MSDVRRQLPAFHYFQVGNEYSGSEKGRRYKITTDRESKSLKAHVYEEPLCFELTKEKHGLLFEETFDLSPEGFLDMQNWLEEKMDARAN